MQQRGDVDVEWDAGTTEVKDFDSEVDTAHAGPEYEKKIRQSAPMMAVVPANASVPTPIAKTKSSPTRAQTEAFGSAAILRSPALGTAPTRVVPKPADDDDAAPEPVKAKEWTAPTEASPLVKARRASSQRASAPSKLPLAAPEPSVLAPLTPVLPRGSQPIPTASRDESAPAAPPIEATPVAPLDEALAPAAFDPVVPMPTMKIEKIRRGSPVRAVLAAVLLVAAASGTYAIGRKLQARPQQTAAQPTKNEVATIVMTPTQLPATPTQSVEKAAAPVVAPEAKPKQQPATVQAKPARKLATTKKAVRTKAKQTRPARVSAPSTTCAALDCL